MPGYPHCLFVDSDPVPVAISGTFSCSEPTLDGNYLADYSLINNCRQDRTNISLTFGLNDCGNIPILGTRTNLCSIHFWNFLIGIASRVALWTYHDFTTEKWIVRFDINHHSSFGPSWITYKKSISPDPHTDGPFSSPVTLGPSEYKTESLPCGSGTVLCNFSNATITIG